MTAIYRHVFSRGALTCIMNNGILQNPVLQVLKIHKLAVPGRIDRYILNLSDSINYCQFVIMTTQLNHLISSGLTKHTLIQITRYSVNFITDSITNTRKKVLVILDLNLLALGDVLKVPFGTPTPVYDYDFNAGIGCSIMSSQAFEVSELLYDLHIGLFMNPVLEITPQDLQLSIM